MRYIIYKNIAEQDFQILHERIKVLQPFFEEFLSPEGFKITDRSRLVDILGLDFVFQRKKTYGNIGFLFDDETPAHTFTFYVTKAIDDRNGRSFKGINILEKVRLADIENNYRELLKKAVQIFNDLKVED
ncbi:MAG TPA: hypothetical protein VFI06_05665 [Chitinophagaceae bacterium]|nr:hypothetical protein [Chitinophagaceae bacterium]